MGHSPGPGRTSRGKWRRRRWRWNDRSRRWGNGIICRAQRTLNTRLIPIINSIVITIIQNVGLRLEGGRWPGTGFFVEDGGTDNVDFVGWWVISSVTQRVMRISYELNMTSPLPQLLRSQILRLMCVGVQEPYPHVGDVQLTMKESLERCDVSSARAYCPVNCIYSSSEHISPEKGRGTGIFQQGLSFV